MADETDPLGLGGSPEPDAPSRRSKPALLSLAGEFFRMSRTTAILLAVFLLAGGLYLLVREDPVLNIGRAGPAEPTEPATPTPSGATTSEDDQPSESTEPTSPTEGTVTTEVPTSQLDDDDDEAQVPSTPDRAPTGASTAVPETTAPTPQTPADGGAPDGQQGGGVVDGGASPTS
ncbi:MAG TPA: hypothetical protein H9759_05910 [Candidatus Dietzia intestinipullorum]|nr:hypothetical protein [Candidatus Dietzia intestinipullorum]